MLTPTLTPYRTIETHMTESLARSPRSRPAPRARWASLALFAAILAGCGGGQESDDTVVVDGSSTVFRISRAAQEAFAEAEPSVAVVVDNHGTGGGFIRYLQNEVDLVGASRKAKPEEEAKAKAQGIDWTRFVVGYDGITVVVHPSNDFVKDLTVAQLKRVWGPDGDARTWKDLDPAWPDRPIRLYCPDKNSGTFEFFTAAICGKARSQKEDVQSSPDDNVLVRGVSGDADAMGYFGYAYYKANEELLRAVPIRKDEATPAVLPSPETILAKAYVPLSRPLYLYAKKSALRRSGVASFVRFYLGKVATFAAKGGYVAPTAEDDEANRRALGPAAVEAPPPDA
ncbi:PstS family phosphate ABC transporter substrate-binding protein [Tundrisphaera sp. TA3]|uniref:PstS family phosphate ABC transporter substrate-binding protein n=1 Tax=Tundrisphaera sp. TA3 TaxID=3435775 RepID=UPI003EBE53C3